MKAMPFIRRLLLSITIVVMLSTNSATTARAWATPDSLSQYDTALLPISPDDLRKSLHDNNHNAVVMVQLLRRADEQNQTDLAYETLDTMRQEQPKTPVVLAAYAFAVEVAFGGYKYHPHRPVRQLSSVIYDQYQTSLQQASHIDSGLWLPYALKGFTMAHHYKSEVKGFQLLEKAEALAPDVSFVHYMLGEVYTLKPTPFMSHQKAAEELQKALSLKPVISDAGVLLFSLYDTSVPNLDKAIAAKKELLATLPPGSKLDDYTRTQLAKYP